MTHPFQYAILRYMHDGVTQEFMNIGVLIYSPDLNHLKIRNLKDQSRLASAFPGIEPLAFERAAQMVETACSRASMNLEGGADLDQLLPRILPENDSALSFSGVSGGVSDDVEEEFDYLYHRMVEYHLSIEH